jgi:hypothetical protein
VSRFPVGYGIASAKHTLYDVTMIFHVTMEQSDGFERPSKASMQSFDPAIYGPLYREFAAEDSWLAEEGMADYASALAAEDRD